MPTTRGSVVLTLRVPPELDGRIAREALRFLERAADVKGWR